MDNYQRLFKESRPVTKEEVPFPDYETAMKMVDSEWWKNLNRGISSYDQDDFNSAITYLNKAIREEPEHPQLYSVRASIKEDSGDRNGAIQDYKKSLYISGEDWYATYHQLGVNYFAIKDLANAIIAYDIAIELKSKLAATGGKEDMLPNTLPGGVVFKVEFAKLYANRANAKLALKDFQGCADDCNKAIKANPDYSNSYYVFGLLFLHISQDEKAYRFLKMAESKGHKQATNTINQYFE